MDTIEIRSMIDRKKLDVSGFSKLKDRRLSLVESFQKRDKKIINYLRGYFVLLEGKLRNIEINYKV